MKNENEKTKFVTLDMTEKEYIETCKNARDVECLPLAQVDFTEEEVRMMQEDIRNTKPLPLTIIKFKKEN